MNVSLILDNFITPPILFFLLGVIATLLRSDLEIPKPAARFLSIYLLFSIGLHGGHELSQSSLTLEILFVLLAAMATCIAIPLWSFAFLKRRLPVPDAAAIAATYGSVSAVTFITAAGFLNTLDIPFGGHMVAAMALMESPAIVVGVLLMRTYGTADKNSKLDWRSLIHEAFLNGSVFLLLGSLAIGWITGDAGWEMLKPVAYDPFKGILCLFLLDMGLVAAKRLRDIRGFGVYLAGFGCTAAVLHGFLGIAIAWGLGISEGDALMFASLVAGASYIAVPAAVRLAIPEANPSIYVPLALGVTFPFNVIVGIPLYYSIIQLLWS